MIACQPVSTLFPLIEVTHKTKYDQDYLVYSTMLHPMQKLLSDELEMPRTPKYVTFNNLPIEEYPNRALY